MDAQNQNTQQRPPPRPPPGGPRTHSGSAGGAGGAGGAHGPAQDQGGGRKFYPGVGKPPGFVDILTSGPELYAAYQRKDWKALLGNPMIKETIDQYLPVITATTAFTPPLEVNVRQSFDDYVSGARASTQKPTAGSFLSGVALKILKPTVVVVNKAGQRIEYAPAGVVSPDEYKTNLLLLGLLLGASVYGIYRFGYSRGSKAKGGLKGFDPGESSLTARHAAASRATITSPVAHEEPAPSGIGGVPRTRSMLAVED